MFTFLLALLLLPGYSQDKLGEASTQYKPHSTGTIKLILPHDPLDTIYAEASFSMNIPRMGSESKLISFTRQGEYYLDLIIDRPASATLNLNNESYTLVLTPGDTSQVVVSQIEKELALQFEGKNSETNQYYLSKKKAFGYTHIRTPLSQSISSFTTYNSFKHKADSITSKELQYLNKYISKHSLPEWFCHYEKAEIEYMGASFKVAMPGYNKVLNYFKDTLPGNYYDFLDNIPLNNTNALLSSSYLLFLDDYFIRYLPHEAFDHLAGYARIEKIHTHALNKSSDVLSPEVKNIYYKHMFSAAIQFLTDSAQIDLLAKNYGVTAYKDLLKAKGARVKVKVDGLPLKKGDQVPDLYLTAINDSLISIRNFEGAVVYINFWASWCKPCIANMPELNKFISEYSKTTEVIFLNISLDSDKERWQTSLKRHQIQGVNLLAEGNWSQKLRTYFSINGIPHYLLLDKGNLLYENNTDKAPAIKRKMDNLLKVKSTEQLSN